MVRLRLGVVGAAVLLGAASTAPVFAFPAQHKDLVQFDAIGRYDGQAWIYDMKCDGVPVRAEYGRVNGSSANLANGNGCGTSATGIASTIRINWAILCNDYSIGDDCSGRLG